MPVHRFDHDRVAESTCVSHGLLDAPSETPRGRRDAGAFQRGCGLVLVPRHLGADQTRSGRHGCPDSPQVNSPAQLHKVPGIEACPRDVAPARDIDDGLRGHTETTLICHRPQLGHDPVGNVGRWATGGDQAVHQLDGDVGRPQTNRFVVERENDLVRPGGSRGACLATGGPCATGSLQLERHVLHDVAQPRSLGEPFRESSSLARPAAVLGEPREGLKEACCKPRDQVRRQLLEVADVDDHAHHGQARPRVRSVDDPLPQDMDSRVDGWQVRPPLGLELHCPWSGETDAKRSASGTASLGERATESRSSGGWQVFQG